MNESEAPKEEQSAADLARQLAEHDQAHLLAEDPDSSTIANLKGKLDTMAEGLRKPPPVDEFEDESECGQAVDFVKAIGRKASGSEHSSSPRPGRIEQLGAIGQYELISKLGEGGMGAVYKARHSKLDKIVAIKVLPPERMTDQAAVSRFEREMRAVGKLEHPNIVRAMDAGEVDGTHFLVMEYVKGVDLSQLSKRYGPLPVAESCELIRQAAIGLDEAHDHEMVHRDIKPSNLILAERRRKPPVVKILDMGLALLSEAHSPVVQGLTSTGQTMGTLDYMAPEQGGDSKSVDIRADIYALGASLYRLLCGEVIFHGEDFQTPVQKIMALATKPIPPIQQRRDGISDELAAVVHRMLEKDPAQRIATPQEVADALAPFAANADLSSLVGEDLSVGSGEPTSTFEPTTDLGSGSADTSPTVDISKGGVTKTVSQASKSAASPSGELKTTSVSLQPKLAQPRTSARGKFPHWIPIAAGLSGVALLAVIILLLPSRKGTIRIEINDPEIEVTVGENGYTIKGATEKEITLEPGEHLLTIKRDGFEFKTDKFVLNKGETIALKVEFIKDEITVRNGETLIGQRAIHGTTKPPATVVGDTEKSRYALAFDGHHDYVGIPTLKIPSGPFTIEAIVELETLPQGLKLANIVSDTGGALYLTANPKDGFTLLLSDENQQYAGQLPNTSALKKRVLVSAVFDGKNFTLTANGKRFSSSSDKFAGMKGHVVLGINPKIRSCFHGTLHELRISKVARNTQATDFPVRMESDINTLALYHFDEGQGEDLKDSSGNHHHGRIVGAKWVQGNEKVPIVADADRRAAEWILSIGGEAGVTVGDREQRFKEGRLLPTEAFKLTYCDLDGNEKVTDDSLAYLKDCIHLEHLYLTNMPQISDVGVSHLRNCRNLKTLKLFRASVTDRGIANFKDCGNLEILEAAGTTLTDAGVVYFRDCDLTQLNLGETLVTDEGLASFSNCTRIGLLYLVAVPNMTDAGLVHFKGNKNLRSVNLRGTPVTDACVDTLAGFSNLRELYVVDTKLTETGLKKLKAALPDCVIYRSGPQTAVAPFNAEKAKQHQQAWADQLGLPVERTIELPGDERLTMMLIPPGEFSMGSTAEEQTRFLEEVKAVNPANYQIYESRLSEYESPQHRVRITTPFYLGKYEVTQAQWEAVTGDRLASFLDDSAHPVLGVSWDDAQAFIGKLNNNRIAPQTKFVLPTEAQWEYACRAGSTTPWHGADSLDALQEYSWFAANSEDVPHPVGKLRANGFGLHDMHGNTTEWCADWYGQTYYNDSPVNDPGGPRTGLLRIVRGGSYNTWHVDCRSSSRHMRSTDSRNVISGFRLAVSLESDDQ